MIAVIMIVVLALSLPMTICKYEKSIKVMQTEISDRDAVIDSLILDSYKLNAFEIYKIKEDTNVKKMD